MNAVAPLAPLPHDHTAEMAMLACLLQDNRTYERVADTLKPEYFSDPGHRRIYETIAGVIAKGGRANPITLAPVLEKADELDHLGGFRFVKTLAATMVPTISAKEYASAIEDAWLRAQIVNECQLAVHLANTSEVGRDARAIIEQVESSLYALSEQRGAGEVRSLGDAAREMLELADAAVKRGSHLVGITTGFDAIDHATGGFEPGNLYVLGARPSMGKTALALGMAHHTAKAGNTVLFFSLEMSRAQLARRLAAAIVSLPISDIKRGKLTPIDFTALFDCERDLRALPLWIDDTAAISLTAVRNRARRLKRTKGLSLVIIDHLSLMRSGMKAENKRLEIGQITAGLKQLAKELNVPVLLLSQLSRAVEGREDKRPGLSDLRESGDIEQDADAVMFLFREHYYAERERPVQRGGESQEKFEARMADWNDRIQRTQGRAEVVIAKQRDGALGSPQLLFDADTARFRNMRGEP
jgi:replicative DNA helicase